MSVIALQELHNLTFHLANLFEYYTMSRHSVMQQRYLSTRGSMEHFITNLSNTEKWANFYIEVHGNYELGSSSNRGHKFQGSVLPIIYLLLCLFLVVKCRVCRAIQMSIFLFFAELGPISRSLQAQANLDNVATFDGPSL